MKSALESINECERLEALGRYLALTTAGEPGFDDITRLAAHICGTPMAVIGLVGPDTVWFKSHYGVSLSQVPRHASFSTHVITDRHQVMVVPDTLNEPIFVDNPLVVDSPSIRFYAGAPLLTADRYVLGALSVLDTTPRTLSLTEIAALESLSRQVVTLMDLKVKESQLRMVNDNLIKIATFDGLTAINNHRAFQETLRTEFARANLRQQPVSLVLVDLDAFKHYNDAHGYASGDLVLKAISEILRRNIRPGDFVARYGGGEFAIILPNTRGKQAVDLAESLRARIAEHAWAHRKVTVSFGVTTSNSSTPDVEQLIAEADVALFSAKQRGGNSVRHQSAIGYITPAARAA